MLEQTSQEFRKFFLLQFTRELIQHSGASDIFKLENLLNKEEKEREVEINEAIQEEEIGLNEVIPREVIQEGEREVEINKVIPKEGIGLNRIIRRVEKSKPFYPIQKKPVFPTQPIQRNVRQVLRIPETKLPRRLQSITPIATDVKIDLGKLNVLTQDPMVKLIECPGAGENLVVKGAMGTKKAGIILDESEIEDIIKKFSSTARIPIQEGIFRVAVGKLIISAIISEVVSSKFIIQKIRSPARSSGQMRPQTPEQTLQSQGYQRSII